MRRMKDETELHFSILCSIELAISLDGYSDGIIGVNRDIRLYERMEGNLNAKSAKCSYSYDRIMISKF